MTMTYSNFTKQELEEIRGWANTNIGQILSYLEIDFDQSNYYLFSECPIPFHPGDADNPKAFCWNLYKNRWYCYTHQCHNETSSDIFGLIQALKECSFPHAVRFLLDLRDNNKVSNVSLAKKTVRQVVKKVAPTVLDKSKLSLLQKDIYFHSRGIEDHILTKHKVGYWQKEGTFLNKRAIVPVFDINGNLVGYSGRTLLSDKEMQETGTAKWIHSLDFVTQKAGTFNKESILYNLNNCKELAKQTKTLYVVEGPIDCWKLEMAGVNNVVATLGLYVTPQQICQLVQLGIERLIICYDNDIKEDGSNPGKEAGLRVKKQLEDLFKVDIKLPTAKDYGEMNKEEILDALRD